MRVTPLTTCVFLLQMTSASLAQRGKPEEPRPVEVWCGGDDGLTLRVCDATKQAFGTAQDLPLSKAGEATKYKVVIPTNVDWKKVRGRIQILYTIQLQDTDTKEIGRFKGSCWESKIRACGTKILRVTRHLLTTIVQE